MKAIIRRITEGNDAVIQVQTFVQNTSLAFRLEALSEEVVRAIEVFHSEVAFQVRCKPCKALYKVLMHTLLARVYYATHTVSASQVVCGSQTCYVICCCI